MNYKQKWCGGFKGEGGHYTSRANFTPSQQGPHGHCQKHVQMRDRDYREPCLRGRGKDKITPLWHHRLVVARTTPVRIEKRFEAIDGRTRVVLSVIQSVHTPRRVNPT